MKPTIGRIVIFHPDEAFVKGSGNLCNGALELPAVITRVWNDTLLNLAVLNDGPNVLWVTSVHEGTGHRSWSWPERTSEPSLLLTAK